MRAHFRWRLGALAALCCLWLPAQNDAASDGAAAEVDALLSSADADGDGSFSREEVRALISHYKLERPLCSAAPHRFCRPAAAAVAAAEADDECLPGWTGYVCDECAPGFGGETCAPLRVAAGEATEAEGCLKGWTGDDCDECAPGFGGGTCAPLPAGGAEVAAATPATPEDAPQEEGCLMGWTGDGCDECAPGYSGESCTPAATNKSTATTDAAGSTQKAQPTGSIRTVEFIQSPPVRSFSFIFVRFPFRFLRFPF